ncbi:MAG: hypothetical protein HFJ10_12225 [Lachnospiraceae bacterium]|nr:hypothetical protein [Lachnospiraceae bacterium]
MPRPRTRIRKSYEELLIENEEKLKKHREAVQLLEKEREELLKAKRDEELQELYQYMQQNNLSAEEIIECLQENQRQEVAS